MSQAERTLYEPPLDELETQPQNESATPAQAEVGPQSLNQLLPPEQESKSRPRPITILALLLFLQAAGLFDLGLFFSGSLGIKASLIMATLLAEPVNTLATGLVFVPLAFLAFLAGIGFLRLWRTAWVMAMLLQGLCLLTALVLYFSQRPPYVYILMLYSIIMVIYLNYSEVYATFQPASILAEEDEV